MEQLREYVLLPLQRRIFKNFGYYDYTEQVFRFNTARVNEILSGARDAFGMLRHTVTQDNATPDEDHHHNGTSSPVSPPPIQRRLRLVKGEVRSRGLLAFLRRLTHRSLTVQSVDLVADLLPGTPPSPPPGGAPSDLALSDELGGLGSTGRGEEVRGPVAEPAMSRCDSLGQDALDALDAAAPSSELPFRTIRDVMRYIKQQLQGSCVVVERIRLTLRVPPAGFTDCTSHDGALREGTVLLHLDCLEGLCASVDRTTADGEDFDVSLRVGECRVYVHTVATPSQTASPLAPTRTPSPSPQSQPIVINGECIDLADLVVRAAGAPWAREEEAETAGHERGARTPYVHGVHLSYSLTSDHIEETSCQVSPRPSTPAVVAMFPTLYTTLHTTTWSVVCGAAQVAALRRIVDVAAGDMTLSPAAAAPTTTTPSEDGANVPQPGITSAAELSSSAGAPDDHVSEAMPGTITEDTLRAAMMTAGMELQAARKLVQVSCDAVSITLLRPTTTVAALVKERVALHQAWTKVLLPRPPLPLSERDVSRRDATFYNSIALPHLTCCVSAVDVLFPHIDVQRAFPRAAQKRTVYRNLFRHALVDSQTTAVMGRGGGSSLLVAARSLHVLEYRPDQLAAEIESEAVAMTHAVLTVEHTPYAMVLLARSATTATSPRIAFDTVEYQDVVFVTNGAVELQLDPDFLAVCADYGALLHRRGEVRSTKDAVDAAPAAGVKRSDKACHSSHISHCHTKLLVEQVHCVLRFPILDGEGPAAVGESDATGVLLRRLLRHGAVSSRAHYAAHATKSPLAFTADRQARFLQDTLCFRLHDVQASGQNGGTAVIRWKKAAVQLEDCTTHRVTELARVDYTAETAIRVGYTELAQRPGNAPVPTPSVLSVQICLDEVTTHAIAQDDYLLALYFVRQLYNGLVCARERGAMTDKCESVSHDVPLCGAGDEEGDADDDTAAAGCRHRAIIQALCQDSSATLTHVSLVVHHAKLQLLVPRLSPQGEALGEPMLRCLPPGVPDGDVRRELLFHRYTIALGGVEWGVLLCDVKSKACSAMETEVRVADVRLQEHIPRLPPHRAQMALVEEVSIMQSFPARCGGGGEGDGEDSLSFVVLATAFAPSSHHDGGAPACLLRYTSHTRPVLTVYGAVVGAGVGQRTASPVPQRATRCVTSARMHVALCGISVHHLPAHYGDFWAAALPCFFCDAAPSSIQQRGNAGDGAAPRGGMTSNTDSGSYGDELRVKVAVREVVWSYRPQGVHCPLLAVLISHVRGWVRMVRAEGTTVMGGGELCKPVTLYVCDDCTVAEFTQEVLRGGAGVSGDCRTRLEAAGFVRVVDLHDRRGDAAGGCVALKVRRPSLSSRATVGWQPVVGLKVHHLHLNAFAARDTVGVLTALLSGLVNNEDLRYVEVPHVLVMQSSPVYFAAVGDEVVRRCAPMTYRINPALNATSETMTWGAPVFGAQPASCCTLRDRAGQLPQMGDIQRAYEQRMRALLTRNAWASASTRQRRQSSSTPSQQQGGVSASNTLHISLNASATAATAGATGDSCVARASSPTAVAAVPPSDSTSSFESLKDWRDAAPVTWTCAVAPPPEGGRRGEVDFDLTAACGWAPHFLSGLVPRPRRQRGGGEATGVQLLASLGRTAPPVLLDLDAQHCGLDVSLYAGRDLDDAATRRRRCGYAHLLRTSQSAALQPVRGHAADHKHSTTAAARGDAADSRVTLARLYHEGRRGQGCGTRREHRQRLVVRLRGLGVHLNGFAAGAEEQRWVRVVVREGTVYDCIENSAVRKMLVATPAPLSTASALTHSTSQMTNFIELSWLTLVPRHVSSVAADAHLPTLTAPANPEEVVHVRLHPLTLTWTGASLDFLLHFWSPDTAGEQPSPATPPVASERVPVSDELAALQPPPMHFRRVVLDPTTITLTGSFESSTGLLAALRQGCVTADTLRNVPIISWLTVDHLRLPLRQICIEDCPAALLLERVVADSRCLSLRFLLTICCCVVQPFSAAARVGEAATGLLLVPLAHYRGVAAFHHALATASSLLVRELVTQSAGVAAMLTDGTYHATRGLLELLLRGTTASARGAARAPGDPATHRGVGARRRYGEPPVGLRDGLQRGQEEMVAGARDAWAMAHYCMRADGSLAQIPAAALRLLMGLSSAATSTLLGVRNAPDAELRRGEHGMYKSSQSLDEWEV